MRKVVSFLEESLSKLASYAVLVMMLATGVDVVGRYGLRTGVPGVYELTESYLLVGVVFLGVPAAYRAGAYVRVTVLADRLSGRARAAVQLMVQLVSAWTALVVTAGLARQLAQVYRAHTTLSVVRVPLWPSYLVALLGTLVFTLGLMLDLPLAPSGRTPTFQPTQARTALEGE